MAKKTNTSVESNSTRGKATVTPKAPAPRHRKAQAKPVEPEVALVAAPENSQELTAEPAVETISVNKPASSPGRSKASKKVERAEPETPAFTITNDDIATLAFSYWERRGCQGGSPDGDWNRAEQELKSLLG